MTTTVAQALAQVLAQGPVHAALEPVDAQMLLLHALGRSAAAHVAALGAA